MTSCSVRLAGRSSVVPHRSLALALPLVVGAFAAARGQLVTPRLLPIRQDEMFAIVPQARAGMGELPIVLDDSLADPFNNPARLQFSRPTVGFAAPYHHSVTGGHGGGSTLPIGAMGSRGEWAGAFVAAVQALDHNASSNPLNTGWFNRYLQGSAARRVRDDLTVGLSAAYTRLNAIDGADLRYGSARSAIGETDDVFDLRVGITKRWGRSRLDVIAASGLMNIAQDVTYAWYTPTPGFGQEYHELADHTHERPVTCGLRTQFTQPFGDGWRLGLAAATNRVSRDPGPTSSQELGFGIGRALGRLSYGIEAVREASTSHLWGRDSSGARAFDNESALLNWRVRAGFGQDVPLSRDGSWSFGYQLGGDVYMIGHDGDWGVRHSDGRLDGVEMASWQEWTPTLGFRLRSHGASIQYNWRMTCAINCVKLPGDKVLVASPSPRMTSTSDDPGRSRFHQLLVTVPLR